ncbi:MAG: cell division topological specificity factor MinE [Oceanococcaceae bacterium]
MSWLTDLFRERQKTTASAAKERLKLVVVHDRMHQRGAPSFLPQLQADILKVLRKYVSVPDSAVAIDVSRDDTSESLELTISVPEASGSNAPATKSRGRR